MRKIFLLPVIFLAVATLQSCLKDKLTKTYTVYEAVYRDKAEVLADIKSSQPRTVSNPGKIYQYGSYLFLNEVDKGVHIIDNSNPSSPVIKAFINIPGNIDIAVKGNTLYADLYTDMVSIDITDPLNARLGKKIDNIFPERRYQRGIVAEPNKYIVDWTERKMTIRVEDFESGNWGCAGCVMMADVMSLASGGGKNNGTGGSMARFSIVNNYMYAVNTNSLNIVDVSNASNPVKLNTYGAGMNIETIYPFKQKLFLGSSNGMFIFDITNPTVPVRQGAFIHARACDPVVADDKYAYVTLRTGTFCQGVNDQMDVVDVNNIMQPTLLKTYSMKNPFGLGKDGNYLFVCDDGLKIYNTTTPSNLQLIKHMKGLETYDVISGNNKLILVAKDGLYQYDYSNINNIYQLSKIQVSRK